MQTITFFPIDFFCFLTIMQLRIKVVSKIFSLSHLKKQQKANTRLANSFQTFLSSTVLFLNQWYITDTASDTWGDAWWYLWDLWIPATWQQDQKATPQTAVGDSTWQTELQSLFFCAKKGPPVYPETFAGVCCVASGISTQ